MAASNPIPPGNRLRVLFVAGGLTKGGAEKQFLYMLRALKEVGAEVQVLTLTQGEFHERSLTALGIQPVYAGSNPAARLWKIIRASRAFRPHFLQASHFFANFYAGLAGRLTGIPSIGAVRSDLHLDLEGVGRLGPWMLRLPTVLLANSKKAHDNALKMGLALERFFVLQNVIDLDDFDRKLAAPSSEVLEMDRIRAITVARLVPVKRLERFLEALALARKQVPPLQGLIVGGGPEEHALRARAEQLGLHPDSPHGGVRFLGERTDIPQLYAQSAMCVLTSDREGFPNVLLEAMAARLPVISTPAGESPDLVLPGQNGYLVPFDDHRALAGCLVQLAESRALRRSLGSAGRRLVEQQYSYPRLGRSLLEVYREIARFSGSRAAQAVLSAAQPAPPKKTAVV